MMTREGYLNAFAAWHPEAGEVENGARLTGEQGEAFAVLFMQKLMSIHAQEEITRHESVFIENTVHNSSSLLRYLLEAKQYQPPRDETMLPNLTDRAVELLAYAEPGVLNPEEWPDSDVHSAVKATALIAGSIVNVSGVPEIRRLTEGYGVVATHLLATLLRDNNGAEIDQYLFEKMQNMIVDYEMVDKK